MCTRFSTSTGELEAENFRAVPVEPVAHPGFWLKIEIFVKNGNFEQFFFSKLQKFRTLVKELVDAIIQEDQEDISITADDCAVETAAEVAPEYSEENETGKIPITETEKTPTDNIEADKEVSDIMGYVSPLAPAAEKSPCVSPEDLPPLDTVRENDAETLAAKEEPQATAEITEDMDTADVLECIEGEL